jgi:hypothetical protein
MKKCNCTTYGPGYLSKECKYHREHCHYMDCKKKIKRDSEYCTKHIELLKNYPFEEVGSSDF